MEDKPAKRNKKKPNIKIDPDPNRNRKPGKKRKLRQNAD
jgi:hypothetical protein